MPAASSADALADLASCFEFTLPCRVWFRGKSVPAPPVPYTALLTLTGSEGGRVAVDELARTLERPPRALARVCRVCTRILAELGFPGRVRVAGTDVVLVAVR